MPDKAKLMKYIDRIYETGWITNYGPLVQELEARLADFLGIKNIVLVANGTVALEIAYKLLKLQGDVITTPFSFVATTSSLVSNGLNPIFADIDPHQLTLDPSNITKVITDQTSAIVPCHVFGNGCDIHSIEKIADHYNLKVIYDAAHSFNVQYKGQSILNQGDVSTLSFHATKVFHSIEGGALCINDDRLVKDARFLINFGFESEENIKALGTNAKMNEFEAAMGLTLLDDYHLIEEARKERYERYYNALNAYVEIPQRNPDCSNNFAYFPILLKNEQQVLKIKKQLMQHDISPRRYFYPSLDTLPYLQHSTVMHVSRDISSRILALPLYPELPLDIQDFIIKHIQAYVTEQKTFFET